MGYQSDLNDLRSQSGSGMGDIRDSYERSKDQQNTYSGNPMGYLDTNYQQQNLGRYVPPMLTGGPGSVGGWNGDGYGQGASGPYNYNIPTAFGGYGNGGYGNYGNTQSAPPPIMPMMPPPQMQGGMGMQGMPPQMGGPPMMGNMGPRPFRPPHQSQGQMPMADGPSPAAPPVMPQRAMMDYSNMGGSGTRIPLPQNVGTPLQFGIPGGPEIQASTPPPMGALGAPGTAPQLSRTPPPMPQAAPAQGQPDSNWMNRYYDQFRRQRMGWQPG